MVSIFAIPRRPKNAYFRGMQLARPSSKSGKNHNGNHIHMALRKMYRSLIS